jgi:thiosulfate dehydrogenase
MLPLGGAAGYYYHARFVRHGMELQEAATSFGLGETVLLGKEIFDRTPLYIGPNGSMRKQPSNGMSCKNCHLDSGTRTSALPLYDAHVKWPSLDARTGAIITLADRINSCVARPMASTPLPVESPEMIALLTYLRWISVGRAVYWRNSKFRDQVEISYLNRAADPAKGKLVYERICQRCHQPTGEGLRSADGTEFVYPLLWGAHSYAEGSSMQRVILLARFVKGNMPYGTTPNKPVLTDEEAFDVAAYVNSERFHFRPAGKTPFSTRPELKPIDFPFGPFADPFTEEQHRYGPFREIAIWHEQRDGHAFE